MLESSSKSLTYLGGRVMFTAAAFRAWRVLAWSVVDATKIDSRFEKSPLASNTGHMRSFRLMITRRKWSGMHDQYVVSPPWTIGWNGGQRAKASCKWSEVRRTGNSSAHAWGTYVSRSKRFHSTRTLWE